MASGQYGLIRRVLHAPARLGPARRPSPKGPSPCGREQLGIPPRPAGAAAEMDHRAATPDQSGWLVALLLRKPVLPDGAGTAVARAAGSRLPYSCFHGRKLHRQGGRGGAGIIDIPAVDGSSQASVSTYETGPLIAAASGAGHILVVNYQPAVRTKRGRLTDPITSDKLVAGGVRRGDRVLPLAGGGHQHTRIAACDAHGRRLRHSGRDRAREASGRRWAAGGLDPWRGRAGSMADPHRRRRCGARFCDGATGPTRSSWRQRSNMGLLRHVVAADRVASDGICVFPTWPK